MQVAKSTGCPAVGNLDLPPGSMHVEDDEQIGCSVAFVLAIVAFGLARRRRRQEFMASWGLWLHFNVQGYSRQALKQAGALLDLARELHDSDLEMEAHHAHIPVLHMMGDGLG
jgi:hypothetical protein